jgi:competence protein ComEA
VSSDATRSRAPLAAGTSDADDNDVAPLTRLGGPPDPWWQQAIDWLRLRQGRTADSRLVGVVLVALLAGGAGAGAVWLLARPDGPAAPGAGASALPMATRRSASAPAGSAPGPSPAGATAAGSTSTTSGGVWVAVAGAVMRPGLYRVADGTRLSGLIHAAGGLTSEADPDRVNLAAAVHDGERVYVPRRGEPGASSVVAGAGSSSAGPGSAGPDGAGGSAGAGPASGGTAGPIDVNRASAADLDRLPGIGPATAQAIIAHRTAKGPFTSVEQLADVRGIGPAKLEQIRGLVVIG